MRRLLLAGLAAATLATGPVSTADAAGEAIELPEVEWSFDGIFGAFDKAALQRGFQVYREVCKGCHSMNLVRYRNLADLGYSEDEIKAIAAEDTVFDGLDSGGELIEREAKPSDAFARPFVNDDAARESNGGALPPDLSLMAEARIGGPTYTYALLTGYEEAPADFELLAGMNYNHYFPGHQIAMPPPLFEDGVEYADGTPATIEQMAHDVTTFLTWAAEPMLEERKETGIKVILFLLVFTGLLYALKRKIWSKIDH